MKTIIQKWNSVGLLLKIFIGLIIGAILGLLCPQATFISIFGSIFVGALKAIAPVLVGLLVMSALSKAGKGIGKRFRTVIILYMATTLIAAVIAVIASYLFPVSIKLFDTVEATPPSGLGEVLKNLFMNMVSNPIGSIADANYMGILFWAVILGLALKHIAKDTTIQTISDLADAVAKVVHWVIQCAPFGIMGLVFSAISENGLAIFTDYGKLLLVLVGCMLFTSLVINPILSSILLKRNAYPLVFKCLKESGLTAFFTRSSAANIPVNMSLCEELGLDKDFYSVSIPLGATINMDGAAITITIMTFAAANTMGVHVDFLTAVLLSVLATLGACGASGVAGGSLLLIPMACSLFGIGNDVAMQVVAVGFIIGVIQDSLETALNSSGDALFTATAEFHDRLKRGEEVDFEKILKKSDM